MERQIRARLAMLPLAPDEGLALLDSALAADEPMLVPVRLDLRGLRSAARAGMVPALLRGLVQTPARGDPGRGESLAERLARVPEEEWDGIVLELVRSRVAAVLGYDSPDAIDPDGNFKDIGFDSLGAVELRNTLNEATGLRLPATLVFDYPSAAAVAEYLRSQVGEVAAPRSPVDEEIDRLEALMSGIEADDEKERVAGRLRSLVAAASTGTEETAVTTERIQAASADEIFELIDTELGQPEPEEIP